MSTILERVTAVVVKEFKVDESEVYGDADWIQLKADPPEVDGLFAAIEQAFSIVISPEAARQLHDGTVGDLVKYLEERIAEQIEPVV